MQFKWSCALTSLFLLLGSAEAQQTDEAKIAAFKKAFSACLEGKKFTVKY